MKPFRKVEVFPANNGISVYVGCKLFVYQQENLKTFMYDLNLYLKDPEAAKKLIYKRWDIKEEDAVTGAEPSEPESLQEERARTTPEEELEAPRPTQERRR